MNHLIITKLRHHLTQIDLSEYVDSHKKYRGARWEHRIMPIFMLPFVFQQAVIHARLDVAKAQQICCDILVSLIGIKDSTAAASKTDKEREVAPYAINLLCCTIGMVWPKMRQNSSTLKKATAISIGTTTSTNTTTTTTSNTSKRKASQVEETISSQKKGTQVVTTPVIAINLKKKQKKN